MALGERGSQSLPVSRPVSQLKAVSVSFSHSVNGPTCPWLTSFWNPFVWGLLVHCQLQHECLSQDSLSSWWTAAPGWAQHICKVLSYMKWGDNTVLRLWPGQWHYPIRAGERMQLLGNTLTSGLLNPAFSHVDESQASPKFSRRLLGNATSCALWSDILILWIWCGTQGLDFFFKGFVNDSGCLWSKHFAKEWFILKE